MQRGVPYAKLLLNFFVLQPCHQAADDLVLALGQVRSRLVYGRSPALLLQSDCDWESGQHTEDHPHHQPGPPGGGPAGGRAHLAGLRRCHGVFGQLFHLAIRQPVFVAHIIVNVEVVVRGAEPHIVDERLPGELGPEAAGMEQAVLSGWWLRFRK